VTFYDDLADSYHLIYPDWGREVRRQGEVLDRLIRAQMGSEPLSILDCSAGIGTQADDELLLAAQNILSKLREDCLFLASIRDYDQILRERPSATMPSLSDSPGGKRVYFQVWEWADDGRTYTIHLFLVTGSGGRWEVQHHQTRYRAVLRAELTEILQEGGFRDVVWHMPDTSGYYQLLVMARKR
jgi:glycine/sarcosine N-methyltransferase